MGTFGGIHPSTQFQGTIVFSLAGEFGICQSSQFLPSDWLRFRSETLNSETSAKILSLVNLLSEPLAKMETGSEPGCQGRRGLGKVNTNIGDE